MGLDVYLYRLNDGHTRKELDAKKEAHEEAVEAPWKRFEEADIRYDDIPEDEKLAASEASDAARKKFPDPEGTYIGYNEKKRESEYDYSQAIASRVVEKSRKYPDGMFEIGYWRSSYNDAGINHVLKDMGLPDLYDVVFENGRDDQESYYVWPMWANIRRRAQELLDQYDQEQMRRRGHRVIEVRHDFVADDAPSDPAAAMEIFLAEQDALAEQKKPFLDYGNRYGEFHFGDYRPEIVAMIPGKSSRSYGNGVSTYLVVRDKQLQDDEFIDEDDGYRKSIEVVIETAQYVLDSGAPEQFYFHWSA